MRCSEEIDIGFRHSQEKNHSELRTSIIVFVLSAIDKNVQFDWPTVRRHVAYLQDVSHLDKDERTIGKLEISRSPALKFYLTVLRSMVRVVTLVRL